MSQKTQDEAEGDPKLCLTGLERFVDSVEHFGERNATVGVCLRIEENFDMAYVIGRSALEIRIRQVVEVLAPLKHGGAGVVDVEE